METLQSNKSFTVPTFFGMCCRPEMQKWILEKLKSKGNWTWFMKIFHFLFFNVLFLYHPSFFWFGVIGKGCCTKESSYEYQSWKEWKVQPCLRALMVAIYWSYFQSKLISAGWLAGRSNNEWSFLADRVLYKIHTRRSYWAKVPMETTRQLNIATRSNYTTTPS